MRLRIVVARGQQSHLRCGAGAPKVLEDSRRNELIELHAANSILCPNHSTQGLITLETKKGRPTQRQDRWTAHPRPGSGKIDEFEILVRAHGYDRSRKGYGRALRSPPIEETSFSHVCSPRSRACVRKAATRGELRTIRSRAISGSLARSQHLPPQSTRTSRR